jgi:hypothetical protein
MKPHRNRPRASLRSPAEERAASLRKSDITFPAVLVVTGASGSGKTTAVRALESRTLKGVRCYYFDTAGVPSPDEMDRGFDGPDQWQATTTQRWFDRFAANADGAAVCVLDGQTRPSFVRTAAERAGIAVARVVLLDCATPIRHARLVGARGPPELSNPRMDCWAAYLRGQADALDLPVIDTTNLGSEAVADSLVGCIETIRQEWSGSGRERRGGW